jgi:ribosomal protein S18 acetylase RimI-like enzyme
VGVERFAQYRSDSGSHNAAATAPGIGATGFPDLADVPGHFLQTGGDFLIAEIDDDLVGMGGIPPNADGEAEVLRLRVHSATRRRGVGRALMNALEERAAQLGIQQMHLDTATNQPEAMAFYRSLGYQEIGREHQPGWSWTLVYFVKRL